MGIYLYKFSISKFAKGEMRTIAIASNIKGVVMFKEVNTHRALWGLNIAGT